LLRRIRENVQTISGEVAQLSRVRAREGEQRRQYDFTIEGVKVFATCNDINRLSKPLQSRFRKLYLKRYSEEQFIHVAGKVLPKLSASVARYVGASLYRQGGDIRDCLSIGRLVKHDDGPNEIAGIMFTIAKYGTEAEIG